MKVDLKKVASPMIASLLLSMPLSARAGGVSTMDIMESALCVDCINYQIVGMCLWMTCTPLGCDTETSVKVKHRLPDMVALAYRNTGESPWDDTAWMAPRHSEARGGGNSHHRSPSEHTTVTFHNVDIIGHPAEGTFFEMLSSFGYTLEGPATPFMPHYLSSLDVIGWRYNLPDLLNPANLQWQVNRLGNWGSIYPRGGFQTQTHPFKSAALAAYRAAHIVTRPNQARLYQSLIADSRQGYWPPEPVSTDNQDTAWQMLYPQRDMSAAVWPDIDDSSMTYDPFSSRISHRGDYAWTVWRTYRGCEQKGAMLIAHFGN